MGQSCSIVTNGPNIINSFDVMYSLCTGMSDGALIMDADLEFDDFWHCNPLQPIAAHCNPLYYCTH
jgi:hypothetical protein